MKHSKDNKTIDWCEEVEGLKYERKFNHGTVYGYNKFKCRCSFCKKAKAISNQKAILKQKVKLQMVIA